MILLLIPLILKERGTEMENRISDIPERFKNSLNHKNNYQKSLRTAAHFFFLREINLVAPIKDPKNS